MGKLVQVFWREGLFFHGKRFKVLNVGTAVMAKIPQRSFLPPTASRESAWQVAAESGQGGAGSESQGCPASVLKVLLQMWVLISFCRYVLIHCDLCLVTQHPLYTMTLCILPKYRGLLQRISHLYPWIWWPLPLGVINCPVALLPYFVAGILHYSEDGKIHPSALLSSQGVLLWLSLQLRYCTLPVEWC